MYWLMKSEPSTFSILDLQTKPQKRDQWEGVRNYEARNYLQAMQRNEQAFFYHSNCQTPGIIGTMKITRTAWPDPTAFDPASMYFDPKSSSKNPRWYCVEVELLAVFSKIISLQDLRKISALRAMRLLQRGNRLSVMPIKETEWKIIQETFCEMSPFTRSHR
jgi:predicted RNA-binding protein with PUA-like domain